MYPLKLHRALYTHGKAYPGAIVCLL